MRKEVKMNNKPSILIVDDRKENLVSLERALEDLDVNIIKASGGNEALQKILEFDINLAIIEVELPELDGYKTVRIMRKSTRTRHLPVIFISAIYSEYYYKTHGLGTGAVDFITYPFDKELLIEKAKVLLELDIFRKKLEEEIRLRKFAEKKLKKSLRKMEKLARKDLLTKLSTRWDMMEKINYEKDRAIRSKKPFAFIMSDIDDFKKINDKYGHNAGDYVLEGIARLFKIVKRKQDVAARWGGEEFLFMLPETSMEGVKIFAEKIRHKIESHVFEYNDHKIHISLTIGVSLYEPSENPEIFDCITKADKALYRGKAEGKNRIVS